MASETQTWWNGHYARYSLTNLGSMGIFSAFKSMKNYFSRSDGTRTEAFWTVDNCNIYEWFLNAESKGEKLGYDGWGKTWFYEMWTPEVDHHLTIKTWLKPNGAEWGLIIRRYPDKEVREKWSQINSVKTHEAEEAEGSKVTSHKTGFVGTDEWTEDRVRQDDSGRERGSVTGLKNGQRFEEKWEIDEPNRTESKEYWAGSRNWGNRFRSNGPQWIKEEWEGLKPDSGTTGPDYSGSLLDNFREALNALKDSEATLKQMVDADHESALHSLIAEREHLPAPSANPEEIIRALSRAHRLLQAHEDLKRELLSSLSSASASEAAEKALQDKHVDEVSNAMDTLYAIMVKNDAVCDTLAAALKDNEIKTKLDGFEDEFERINSEFGETQDTAKLGEMLNLLLRYQPINYEMAGRLHGMSSEQSAQDMSDQGGKAGLKQQRAKVRSGRPVSSAFDVISDKLNKDLSLTADALDLFAEDKEADAKSKQAQSVKGDPIESIVKKVDVLTEMLEALLASPVLTDISTKENTHLTLAAQAIFGLTGDEEPTSKSEEVKAEEGSPIEVIRKKMDVLDELLKTLAELQISVEETETETHDTVQETREESIRTLELKDGELVKLKDENLKKDSALKILREEVEELKRDSAAFKELQGAFALLQAEKEKLTKQLAGAKK